MDNYGHWTYNLEEKEIPEHFYGFIYLITNTTNQKKYIGKKQARTIKKRPPLKGRKNKRHVEVETDWKTYTGSSDRLNEDIEKYGKDGSSSGAVLGDILGKVFKSKKKKEKK